MTPRCNICEDTKRVRLPVHHDMEFVQTAADEMIADTAWKEFDCPQCVKKVPYKRVRAMKVITEIDAAEFGKFQNPIQRGLAARFGEYLMKQGLIKFGTDSVDDFSKAKIQVSAEINVVTREDAKIAGVTPAIGAVDGPELSKKLQRQEEERQRRAERWTERWGSIGNAGSNPTPDWARERWRYRGRPGVDVVIEEEPEEAEPEAEDAIANRFSGLEL